MESRPQDLLGIADYILVRTVVAIAHRDNLPLPRIIKGPWRLLTTLVRYQQMTHLERLLEATRELDADYIIKNAHSELESKYISRELVHSAAIDLDKARMITRHIMPLDKNTKPCIALCNVLGLATNTTPGLTEAIIENDYDKLERLARYNHDVRCYMRYHQARTMWHKNPKRMIDIILKAQDEVDLNDVNEMFWHLIPRERIVITKWDPRCIKFVFELGPSIVKCPHALLYYILEVKSMDVDELTSCVKRMYPIDNHEVISYLETRGLQQVIDNIGLKSERRSTWPAVECNNLEVVRHYFENYKPVTRRCYPRSMEMYNLLREYRCLTIISYLPLEDIARLVDRRPSKVLAYAIMRGNVELFKLALGSVQAATITKNRFVICELCESVEVLKLAVERDIVEPEDIIPMNHMVYYYLLECGVDKSHILERLRGYGSLSSDRESIVITIEHELRQ